MENKVPMHLSATRPGLPHVLFRQFDDSEYLVTCALKKADAGVPLLAFPIIPW